MKIIKYKKTTKGRYKIYLDDGRELLLYEDVILKFSLLLKKEILEKDIMEIELFNQECDVYHVALESINRRFKSTYDLKESLLKKEYPYELVEKAIEKLLKQGYLNDQSFAKSYINNQIITTNKGPYKIRRELSEHRVDTNIIEEEIEVFDEDTQLEKIRKVTTRLYNSNRNRGGVVLKKKIVNDLVNLGYDTSVISKVINDFDFSNDKDIAKKEYEKLYKKYSRKYDGKELEYKIKEKLYQKGLYYED
ncbi:MAG: RecX family transcriptional regulator [Bacilli bacterium]|nr:RecX family transcriptional regulator [Bacilli bacterium]